MMPARRRPVMLYVDNSVGNRRGFTDADFNALDGKPIDLVFLLLLPESAKGEQLTALACVARKFRSPTLTTALRQARDGTEMLRLLTSE